MKKRFYRKGSIASQKGSRSVWRSIGALAACALIASGCGRHERSHDSHDHSHAHSESTNEPQHVHGHDDDHGSDHNAHDHESDRSGAEFSADRGVILSDDIRRNIGLEVASAVQRVLPSELRFTLQIFGEQHRHPLADNDHTGCDVHGSALLPMEKSGLVRIGQPVEVIATNATVNGVVLGSHRALALGELEIVVGLSNAATVLRSGEFLPARIRIPRDEPVTAIPKAALLRVAEGKFVYVQSNGAFKRRSVTAGTEADDWIEITTGLASGEQVAVRPVETLWLIELRATRGGGHSH